MLTTATKPGLLVHPSLQKTAGRLPSGSLYTSGALEANKLQLVEDQLA